MPRSRLRGAPCAGLLALSACADVERVDDGSLAAGPSEFEAALESRASAASRATPWRVLSVFYIRPRPASPTSSRAPTARAS